MQQYDAHDPAFDPDNHFLSPSTSSVRKSPSRPAVSNRRSSTSLRVPNAHNMDDDGVNGRHSLAHELAVALMPEPSAGSKLLAEEFGIEYDEGAEGIDDTVHIGTDVQVDTNSMSSLQDEFSSSARSPTFQNDSAAFDPGHIPSSEYDPVFDSPSAKRHRKQTSKKQKPEQDPMEVLAHDLESTDKFLDHLRRLDVDLGSTSSVAQQPSLEHLASDVIRKINESVRDREGQVRELLVYEREFRRIAGEVGGSEVLGHLDELGHVEDLTDDDPLHSEPPRAEVKHALEVVEEEPSMSQSNEWEIEQDRHALQLDDDDEELESVASPVKDAFPPPPPIHGPPTPAKTIPQMTHLRSFTTSLVTSLTTISEQAQVNAAATTEAGRKIRALKNKLGGWRTEWDSAERSRIKIDRWEAGLLNGDGEDAAPLSPGRIGSSRRVDGRTVVQEHLRAFELALADAALKTQAIMAA